MHEPVETNSEGPAHPAALITPAWTRWRWLLLAILLLPLLAQLYRGQYNRAMADDFCFTAEVQDRGIFGTLDYWYNNWTGTYSSTFVQSMTGSLRAWQFVPQVLIVLWVLVAAWAIYQVLLARHVSQARLTALLLAALLVFAVSDGTVDVLQSFYWTSGSVTYTLPLLVLTLNLGVGVWLLRAVHPPLQTRLAGLLIAGLSLLAGGFSPLFATVQVTLFGLLFLAAWRYGGPAWKYRAMRLCFVAGVFALTALVILYIAPGNAVRRSRFDFPFTPLDIVRWSLQGTLGFVVLALGRLATFPLLLVLLLGGRVGWEQRQEIVGSPAQARQTSLTRRLLPVLLFGLTLIFMATFVPVLSINEYPPSRAYVVPQTALVVTIFITGYLAGWYLPPTATLPPVVRHSLIGLGLVIMCTGPVLYAARTLATVPDFAIYAREWDARDARIRAAAETDPDAEVVVPPLTYDLASLADVAVLSPQASDNTCVANYYRVLAIRTTLP